MSAESTDSPASPRAASDTPQPSHPAQPSDTSNTPKTDPAQRPHQPISIIALGMAGSGKSTFVSRLSSYLYARSLPSGPPGQEASTTETNEKGKIPYIVNLDPAVREAPFGCNVDIRDTVDYPSVMQTYNLGPNGAILTSLNLFTTKFDQVLDLIQSRSKDLDHVLVDTPGQIEIFTWSASGTIITDALASAGPTVVVYVVDTPRCTAPATFMSNMLYACSILYKSRLPFVVVFNKTDVQSADFALEWMSDFEAFQRALNARPATQTAVQNASNEEPTYMNSLINSMSLVLEEFYTHLTAVGVSAYTGDGFDEFMVAIEKAREEYYTDYAPELERVRSERAKKKAEAEEENMSRLMADVALDKRSSQAKGKKGQDEEEGEISENEDGGEGPLLDRRDVMAEKEEEGPYVKYGNERMARAGEDGTFWPPVA